MSHRRPSPQGRDAMDVSSLMVVVRARPLNSRESSKGSRDIVRVIDKKTVVVLDPDTTKPYLDQVQNRTKEKQFTFDIALDPKAKNSDVYDAAAKPMIEGVTRGLNATVFAYGATGSGKTWTMVGNPTDPGLMVLSFNETFQLVNSLRDTTSDEFEILCSYLEIYNEVIYDLLVENSSHLELREDPMEGVVVAGLKQVQVDSPSHIMTLLNEGNSRRKTDYTAANAVSSRSHAVLRIDVKRKQRGVHGFKVLLGKLCLVDLAGSERAAETKNDGTKLRDGANINKSLLALANCINALGKNQGKALAYVPYRNSKLTRLLKDGLSGNSRTSMVAVVSPAADQYHHTANTLKYADRAKEIKTHSRANINQEVPHTKSYQNMIESLQAEIASLKGNLAGKQQQGPTDDFSWLESLSDEIRENVEERINLQKDVIELEDLKRKAARELELVTAATANCSGVESTSIAAVRRQEIVDSMKDNDITLARKMKEIEANDEERVELEAKIDEALKSNRNPGTLRVLRQYRLLGTENTELRYQIAMRDQVLQHQLSAFENLWKILEAANINLEDLIDNTGVTIERSLASSIEIKFTESQGGSTSTIKLLTLLNGIGSESHGASPVKHSRTLLFPDDSGQLPEIDFEDANTENLAPGSPFKSPTSSSLAALQSQEHASAPSQLRELTTNNHLSSLRTAETPKAQPVSPEPPAQLKQNSTSQVQTSDTDQRNHTQSRRQRKVKFSAHHLFHPRDSRKPQSGTPSRASVLKKC